MSRHPFYVKFTQQMRDYVKTKFNINETPDNAYVAWGLDHDGYFIQISFMHEDDELYLEDGLIGSGKNKILDTLEKFGLVEQVKTSQSEHFTLLCLDLPF